MDKSKICLNHKSNSMDVTMVSGDNNENSAHKIILSFDRLIIKSIYF